ncbi:MAG: HlyC/CorC family transporter [Beijerinckiaceae bacterium]
MSDAVDMTWLAATTVASGLFAAAFLSASETAMTAASRTRLLSIELGGDARASVVLRLLENKERLIGGLMIARILVNAANISFVSWLFVSRHGPVGILYAMLMMTALIALFGEMIPKMLAIARPHLVSIVSSRVAAAIVAASTPLFVAVQGIARRLLRMAGVRVRKSMPVLSAHEELTGAVDLVSRESGPAKSDRDMISGLLDLKDLVVSDVMVHRTRMQSLDADQPAEMIVSEVLASPYTRMPLWRESPENIVGLIHAKDMLRAMEAAGGDPSRIDLKSIMLPPWFVPDTTALPDQLRAFLQRKSHFAFAIDEYGVVMGMVTLEDVIEEIVGDIKDEHDAPSGMRTQADGGVIVEGTTPIRDINRAMNWTLPDDATTIAGLVINEARVIPDARQTFTFHGYRFTVLRMQRNRIAALRISPLQPPEAQLR